MADEASLSPSQSHLSDVSPTRKRKKRVRTWTASDRAKHRIFEKGRREAFNERLMDLAGLLPALSNAKETQLSKHVIVDESVKHHQAQDTLIETLRNDMDRVLAEHEKLLSEFIAFREAMNSQNTHAEMPAATAHSDNLPSSAAPSTITALPQTQAAAPYGAPHTNRGGEWMLDALNPIVDETFHQEDITLQMSPTAGQSTMPANMSMNAPLALQDSLVFDTASTLSPQGILSGGFPEGLQIPLSQTMGYFDASRFQMSDNNNWTHNPQMNTYEIFNIDQGGTMYPSIITHG